MVNNTKPSQRVTPIGALWFLKLEEGLKILQTCLMQKELQRKQNKTKQRVLFAYQISYFLRQEINLFS